ncbi:putative ABC transporter [Pyrodictium delaneyi]|uniref:Putative ABC transporter n=1 Tax=Pyrodictium delaneyi TaxID=1273541 RepID=A0A0P0N2D7_9CREN|nr:ABC transporter permease [Pyrodictium delaneyi]ALL00702.1 putative ABC transporter [Pyrodictium delaneyi]
MNASELADMFVFALKVLSERKIRSLLTIVGIAIGPIALVAIMGVVQGYSGYVIKQLAGLGQNLIVLVPGADYKMTEDDVEFLKSLPGVEAVTPFYSIRAEVKQGAQKVEAAIYAVDMEIFFKALGKLRVEEGSIPPPGEVIGSVIGHYIAFGERGHRYYSLGDVLTVSYYELRPGGRPTEKRINVIVRGVLAEFGNAFFVNPDTTIFLPLSAGSRLLGMKEWSGVIVVVEDPVYVENLTRTLREVYQERVGVISLVEISRVVSTITAAMEFITMAAGGAAFVVAVTGVAATMITSVMERTREIGVLKAIGFTSREVVAMILIEALVMSLIGAAVGIAIGVAAAYALSGKGMVIKGVHTLVIKAEPAITPKLIGLTLVMTITVGVVGGALPAYQAARIPPAVALRYE